MFFVIINRWECRYLQDPQQIRLRVWLSSLRASSPIINISVSSTHIILKLEKSKGKFSEKIWKEFCYSFVEDRDLFEKRVQASIHIAGADQINDCFKTQEQVSKE